MFFSLCVLCRHEINKLIYIALLCCLLSLPFYVHCCCPQEGWVTLSGGGA